LIARDDKLKISAANTMMIVMATNNSVRVNPRDRLVFMGFSKWIPPPAGRLFEDRRHRFCAMNIGRHTPRTQAKPRVRIFRFRDGELGSRPERIERGFQARTKPRGEHGSSARLGIDRRASFQGMR
jgi:hypothetical protein